jgi:cell division protein FtsA
MEEIFKMAREKLDKLALSRPLGGGIVLTGGGAQLLGAAELASDIFGMRARIGSPLPVRGLVEEYCSPVYATAVGLVLEGNDREGRAGDERSGDGRREKIREPLISKLIDWLEGFF